MTFELCILPAAVTVIVFTKACQWAVADTDDAEVNALERLITWISYLSLAATSSLLTWTAFIIMARLI